jgi:DNA-directed RNA polymerase subunit M
MKFCPDCGAKLRLKPIKRNYNSNRLEYWCPKCEYVQENLPHSIEAHTAKPNNSPETVVIIDDEALQLRTLPTTKAECAKCANNEAYFWLVQTRSGDEGSTQFFRCTTCNHTWRLYT